MNGLCALFIREGINVYFVCNHKCRIETKTEMADNLVAFCFIFVFFNEIRCTGKSDLVDVLLNLLCCHTDTIVNNLDCLIFRADNHLNLWFEAVRQLILSHHVKLFELCDGITSIGNQLPVKNIMVRIQPFLNNRKNILAID